MCPKGLLTSDMKGFILVCGDPVNGLIDGFDPPRSPSTFLVRGLGRVELVDEALFLSAAPVEATGTGSACIAEVTM